jgi:DNA-binding transcriptional regulator YhcF (GntR family)
MMFQIPKNQESSPISAEYQILTSVSPVLSNPNGLNPINSQSTLTNSSDLCSAGKIGLDKYRIRFYFSHMPKTLSIPTKNSGNTPERIAASLRTAILHGQLKSSQPLRQDQLAEQFGVSKIPVRKAMVQLRAEGLIVFAPNRGFVVSELSPAEVEEIYMMRMALETKALERAIPKLRSADLIRAASVLASDRLVAFLFDQSNNVKKGGKS